MSRDDETNSVIWRLGVQASIDEAFTRIEAMENYTGLDVRSAPTPKPTIKGGWVNVYRANRANAWHPTREDADMASSPNRIACIQLPDITEGDGL